MTRPTDPRGASRRGGTDAGDIGYTVANGAPSRPHRPQGLRYSPPQDIHGITRAMQQRAATGLCVVCHQPAPLSGATCKAPDCVRAWIFGA
jgi:hypothetical protein